MQSQQFVWCIRRCQRIDKPNGTFCFRSIKSSFLMLSCLWPEDVWTWLVMLGIFMNSMSAEDSEPGCSCAETRSFTRLEIGLWICDVLIHVFFPIHQKVIFQPQYPENGRFNKHLLRSLEKMHLWMPVRWTCILVGTTLAHTKLAAFSIRARYLVDWRFLWSKRIREICQHEELGMWGRDES